MAHKEERYKCPRCGGQDLNYYDKSIECRKCHLEFDKESLENIKNNSIILANEEKKSILDILEINEKNIEAFYNSEDLSDLDIDDLDIDNLKRDFKELKVEQLEDSTYGVYIYNNENDRLRIGLLNDDDIAAYIFKKKCSKITEDEWIFYDEELGTLSKETYAKKLWQKKVDDINLEHEIKCSIDELRHESSNSITLLKKLIRKYFKKKKLQNRNL